MKHIDSLLLVLLVGGFITLMVIATKQENAAQQRCIDKGAEVVTLSRDWLCVKNGLIITR
jgi:hypothetical protein